MRPEIMRGVGSAFALLAIAGAGLVGLAGVAMAQQGGPVAPVSSNVVPNSAPRDNDYLKAVQRQMWRLGCYTREPAYATGDAAADGKWGGETTKAWNNLLTKLSTQGLNRRDLEGKLIALATNWCNSGNGSGSSNPQVATGTCRAEDVASNYLNLHSDAKQLSPPLKAVSNGFETIFPSGKVPDGEVVDKQAQDRLKRYGTPGVSRQVAKKTFENALKQFSSLVLQYGLNGGGDCDYCNAINDWKFLRNYAQSRKGYLFHSQSPNFRMSVSDITRDMMYGIRDNVLIFRRMTDKWVDLIQAGKDEYVYVDEKGEEITIKLKELADERGDEMNRLVVQLKSIEAGKVTVLSQPRGSEKMVVIEKDFNCVGFDGSTIRLAP